MVTPKLPFDPFAAYREFARVTPHCGTATFRLGDTTIVGAAEFLLPASGHAIIALHTEKHVASQDFGQDLVAQAQTRPSPAAPARAVLYASVGAELTQYDIDVERATLTRRQSVTLPANVQEAALHLSRRALYVGWSTTGPATAPWVARRARRRVTA